MGRSRAMGLAVQRSIIVYKHADDDAALASAKLLLKGGELRLPEAITKVLAARDALRGEVKILEDGLGALREQLKDAYSNKKTTYTALDYAAAAVLRADSDKLAQRLATILEEVARLRNAFAHIRWRE